MILQVQVGFACAHSLAGLLWLGVEELVAEINID